MRCVVLLRDLGGPLPECEMPPMPITEIPAHPWLCLSKPPHRPRNRALASGAVEDKPTPVAAGVRLTTAMRRTPQSAHAQIAPLLYLLQTAAHWVMVLTQRMRMGPKKA